MTREEQSRREVRRATAAWRVREAESIALVRERNEWIEESHDAIGDTHVTDQYECECGDRACAIFVSATRDEYEAVRSDATHFIVATDHEDPETDLLFEEGDLFSVVDKMPGTLSRVARRRNPRGDGAT
ncbi:MAG: hypothetical protein NVSMB57_14700 [Actinomycetota bacterium]